MEGGRASRAKVEVPYFVRLLSDIRCGAQVSPYIIYDGHVQGGRVQLALLFCPSSSAIQKLKANVPTFSSAMT